MKKVILAVVLTFLPFQAKADLWGGDLPLLAKIVFNTLHTMIELERQTRQMEDAFDGIKDKINRIRTIADVVQPASWEKWKDPLEAVNRLRLIYHTIPKEYRSQKYDAIEEEISKAMNLVARISPEAATTFKSGKELEQRGADASPGVAQKLTASGIGTLIATESQTHVILSHITSLVSQILADANEKETRAVATRGSSMKSFSESMGGAETRFSRVAIGRRRS